MTPVEMNIIISRMHSHPLAIEIGGIVSLIGGWVQFVEIMRLGFRHRTHAVPLFVNLFWLANDLGYVCLFWRWFHDVPDPVFRMAWYIWIPFPIMELVMAWQIINYSGRQIFGDVTKQQSYAIYAALQIGVFVFFYWLNETLDDYFFIISGMLTVIGSNMGLVLLATRRSRKGQSLLLAGTLLFNQGLITFFFFFPAESQQLATPGYYVLATIVVLTGYLYFYLLWQTPPYIVQNQFAETPRLQP